MKVWVEWTLEDQEQLKALWWDTPKAKLLKTFPGRSWGGLKSMAFRLELRRKFMTGTKRRLNLLAADLTRARQKAGLTQKELAYRIGTDQEVIARAEQSGDHVSLFMLRAWCDALGLRLRAEQKPKTKPDAVFANPIEASAARDMKRWREAQEAP